MHSTDEWGDKSSKFDHIYSSTVKYRRDWSGAFVGRFRSSLLLCVVALLREDALDFVRDAEFGLTYLVDLFSNSDSKECRISRIFLQHQRFSNQGGVVSSGIVLTGLVSSPLNVQPCPKWGAALVQT